MEWVKIELVPGGIMPTRATSGSAGWDVYACLVDGYDVVLEPGAVSKVSVGFKMQLPPGWEAQMRPRSGLASKGVTLINSPGTIDSDYRGLVSAIVINHGHLRRRIKHGDRIAQLVFAEVPRVQLVRATSLDATDRGDGGFGSTGQ